jgi:molybdenum cofactor cytidylyltransferase
MWAVGIVPAAGKGERFGGAKLLADLKGEPVLNHTLRSLLDGGVRRVIVVVAPKAGGTDPAAALKKQVPLLSDSRVVTAVNPDPSRGMFSSIQTAVSGAVGDLFVVLPGDMPFVRAESVKAVVEASHETGLIVSPSHGGRRGHPVAIPGRLRAAIVQAKATATLQDILAPEADHRIEIDVKDAGILRDVDTKEALSDQ